MTIAIVAHDSKKELMAQFCIAYEGVLSKCRLIASGVSKNTSFNFFEKNGTAAPTSYYFIDDIEVRLLD